MFKHFGGSLLFTLFGLVLGGWYGWALTGTIDGMLGIVWICAVLAVLEVSLSFDNAAVNASVLKDMDPVWQQRFLTWGIAIAVFGMRIVFPLVIVMVAASLGPIEAMKLALNEPTEYQRIVSEAHIGLMGFGGAFLYLEVLDASFSFDGVIGAFALTNNLIIIAIGLGIGAMFVRSMTIFLVNKGTMSEYRYLEHGAFYAIMALAVIMYINTFAHIPEVITGVIGAVLIGAAFWSSVRWNRANPAQPEDALI